MGVKNEVVKPFLITLMVLLIFSLLFYGVLHLFFPIRLSNFYYSMGANNMSVKYLEQSYNKTKDYNQLYSLVNLTIKTKNHNGVKKHYEKFYNNDNYASFVLSVDEKNLNSSNLVSVKSTLYSEDNYLKNKYILSLIELNMQQQAFNFAQESSTLQVSEEDIGIYIYYNIFLNKQNFSNLNNLIKFSKDLKEYYQSNIIVFNHVATEEVDYLKSLILATRINQIAVNLKQIIDFNSSFVTLTLEEINNTLADVKATIAGFV